VPEQVNRWQFVVRSHFGRRGDRPLQVWIEVPSRRGDRPLRLGVCAAGARPREAGPGRPGPPRRGTEGNQSRAPRVTRGVYPGPPGQPEHVPGMSWWNTCLP